QDLRGMKIRTIPSPLQQEMVRLLGASPTPIAWSELYTALATGVVSGTKNGVQDIVAMNFHENIRYLTVDRHAYMGALWWFSEPRWERLSAEEQAVVAAGMARLREVTLAAPKAREAEAYRVFRGAGGEVLALDEAARRDFKRAVAPLRAWYAARHGEQWLTHLDAALGDCEAAHARDESTR
ncbi:MAG: TRAP transporter substrate-binding protein DctP, partial [Pseudomonadota bacterium]